MKIVKCMLLVLSLISVRETICAQSFFKDKVEFYLRGKALGMVFIEDTWARSFSLGTEIKLNKRFAFVADVVHFRWRYEEEVYDLQDPEKYNEYSQYDARNYLAFELKYYPQFSFAQGNFKPYVNIFSKFGKRSVHNQEKYPVKTNDLIRLNGAFQDLGASLGFTYGKRFGGDFNIGAVYRWEKRDEQIFVSSETTSYRNDVEDNRWMANVRLNLYFKVTK